MPPQVPSSTAYRPIAPSRVLRSSSPGRASVASRVSLGRFGVSERAAVTSLSLSASTREGATRAGLLLAARLADEAFVFFDPAGGTFHPKIYFAEGLERAYAFVGSHDPAAGGLYGNYEAALEVIFELPVDQASRALTDLRAYIANLRREAKLCLALDATTIDALVADPRYRVARIERRRQTDRLAGAGDPASADDGAAGDLFGRRRASRPALPRLSSRCSPNSTSWKAMSAPPPTQRPPTMSGLPSSRWALSILERLTTRP